MQDTSSSSSPTPSEERLLDAEEIERVAQSLQRPTARMQLESLAKKLRKEAAGLRALESVNDEAMTEAATTTTTATTSPMEVEETTPVPPKPVLISSTVTPTITPAGVSVGQRYTNIDRFAFDAGGYNEPFITLYISLPGVGKVPKDQIACDFTKDSFDLIIRDWDGKSYRLFRDHLEKDIDPAKSKFVVKADKVIVKLQKIKGEYGSYDYWSKLTDPKKNEKKKTSKDPSSSITDLMKDMYESGDDNMKKMIAETMLKQRNGELNKTDPLKDDDF
jgi:calcyclin binding protein